jgi:hypothetical protein
MTEPQFFNDWKSVREQLQDLVNDLDGGQAGLGEVKDGVLKLAKLNMMVVKALEVLGEDYAYTIKMLKEREGK